MTSWHGVIILLTSDRIEISLRKVVSRYKFTEQILMSKMSKMFTPLNRTIFQNVRTNCVPFLILRMAEEIM